MDDIPTRVSQIYAQRTAVNKIMQRRSNDAFERYRERCAQVASALTESAKPVWPWEWWQQGANYLADSAQRSVLFWDTLRQRGDNYLEHVREGTPPVLHFKYEMVLDARHFDQPVNYALVRIVPPEGVTVDAKKRPYMIIDPRAGHGPGIGGFKDDSQVGMALRAGHPVYFVIFFPNPEPGQTLMDVCAAEEQFVHKVRELHPDSAKPVIVGNCQGGWAAMMLAASNPDEMGPIVIAGAPMSYWGGAWTEGEGNNPMRYSGGLLGGTWLASATADAGNGKFDGAWLVYNFENLNPGNTFWDKYYTLYSRIDTEPPRFLEFERWWGGYFLMNTAEIEWIVRNLFVGNTLWREGVRSPQGQFMDLRELRSPIVMFASMGDNITPPQQAFNWVADTYKSTEEIKARGQVIVGLLHPDSGHLGIFVSGKVAKREYRELVSVLDSIEALPPGLYAMNIIDEVGADGETTYRVEFQERELEEVAGKLNRFERVDEKAFEAVGAVSEMNQRAYELFARPIVQALSNDTTARLARQMHPLRVQHWSISGLNPWLDWLPAAADLARQNRVKADTDSVPYRVEHYMSDMISAGWDLYRDLRDAWSEHSFFNIFGPIYAMTHQEATSALPQTTPAASDPRQLPVVRDALASMTRGGLIEAIARTASLMAEPQNPMPLAELHTLSDILKDYTEIVGREIPPDERRRIRGEQDIIVRYAPQEAVSTLPQLLHDDDERERYVMFFEKLAADPRIASFDMSDHQREVFDALLARIGQYRQSRNIEERPAGATSIATRRRNGSKAKNENK
ncbi:DUF3141 domain-containing protein, partial [Uliginosibacterium sp. sgz301328]|uniref:DUF3141 domain-containing protein n=1 Tax=Uliginosibacterium sp. sgz301328 TaxID=3243764 RepID=UPI00359E5462